MNLRGRPEFVSDLLPATDGLFLGESTTPRRWDASRLINLPATKNFLASDLIYLTAGGDPWVDQFSGIIGCGPDAGTINAEARVQTIMIAGAFRKMKVWVGDVMDMDVNIPVTLRKNGVATAATVTLLANTSQAAYTWSGSVSFAEGDKVSVHYDLTGLGDVGYMALLNLTFEFQPS